MYRDNSISVALITKDNRGSDIMVEMGMLIPIIVALGELWKKVFGKKVTKFIPLINLALGIAGGMVYSNNIKEGIYNGILVGLSASGLYSSAKHVMQINGKE